MMSIIFATVTAVILAGLFAYLDWSWIKRIRDLFSDLMTARRLVDEHSDPESFGWPSLTFQDVRFRPKVRSNRQWKYVDIVADDMGTPVIELVALILLVGLQLFIVGCMFMAIAVR